MSRILIVEDEPATALAVAESLEDDGHSTTHVTTAESALERLSDADVDLVITDLRLLGADGRTLARRLAAGRRPLPVIVLTAYGSREVLEELRDLGVQAIFPKPFRVDQLRRCVREVLASGERPASGGRAAGAGPQ